MRVAPSLVLLLACSFCAPAQESISSVYQELLRNSGDPNYPSEAAVYESLSGSAIPNLSPEEVNRIEDLAVTALKDKRPEVRRCGMLFFLGLTTHANSSALIGPVITSIEAIAGNQGPLRQGALYTLGNTLPRPSAPVVSFLAAQLHDPSLSAEEALAVTGSLLFASTDDGLINRTVGFARASQEHLVREGVARQIGIRRLTVESAVSFLADSLVDKDSGVRMSAILAIARLPLSSRTRFAAQVEAISTDKGESEDLRNAAKSIHFRE